MDHLGGVPGRDGRFREVLRRRPAAHPAGPAARLAVDMIISTIAIVFGLGLVWAGSVSSIVAGVLMIGLGGLYAVTRVQQFGLAVRARRLPAEGTGLAWVEGPARVVHRSRAAGFLEVAGERFDLNDCGGPIQQMRLVKAITGPTVARAWFLPGRGLADPVLVRIYVRPRTDDELRADVRDLEARFAANAAAGRVRPDREQEFVADLPAMRAGFAPGASPQARKVALRRLVRYQRLVPGRGPPPPPPPAAVGRPGGTPRPPVPREVVHAFRLWRVVGGTGLMLAGVPLVLIALGAPGTAATVVALAVLAVYSGIVLYLARRMLDGARFGRAGVAVTGGLWGLLLIVVGLYNLGGDAPFWSVRFWALLALALGATAAIATVLMFRPRAAAYFRSG